MAPGVAGIDLQASAVLLSGGITIAGIELQATQLEAQISRTRGQLSSKRIFRQRFRAALLFRELASQTPVVLRVPGRLLDCAPQLLFGVFIFARIRQQNSQVSAQSEIRG